MILHFKNAQQKQKWNCVREEATTQRDGSKGKRNEIETTRGQQGMRQAQA